MRRGCRRPGGADVDSHGRKPIVGINARFTAPEGPTSVAHDWHLSNRVVTESPCPGMSVLSTAPPGRGDTRTHVPWASAHGYQRRPLRGASRENSKQPRMSIRCRPPFSPAWAREILPSTQAADWLELKSIPGQTRRNFLPSMDQQHQSRRHNVGSEPTYPNTRLVPAECDHTSGTPVRSK